MNSEHSEIKLSRITRVQSAKLVSQFPPVSDADRGCLSFNELASISNTLIYAALASFKFSGGFVRVRRREDGMGFLQS